MYELFIRTFVKVGEGEDATYGRSERRLPLTKEELASPEKLAELEAEMLESISNEEGARGKTVVLVPYAEYAEYEKKAELKKALFGGLAEMLGLGGGKGLGARKGGGMSLADILGGMGHDPENCAECDDTDCPDHPCHDSDESDPFLN